MSKPKRKRKISYLKKMVKASLLMTTLLGGVGKVSASDPAVMAAVARKFPGLVLTMAEIMAAGGIEAAGKKKMLDNAAAAERDLIASLTPERVKAEAKAEATAEVQAEHAREMQQRDAELAEATFAVLTTQIAALELEKAADPTRFSSEKQKRLEELERQLRNPGVLSVDARKEIWKTPLGIDPDSLRRKSTMLQAMNQIISPSVVELDFSATVAPAASSSSLTSAPAASSSSLTSAPAAVFKSKKVKSKKVIVGPATPTIKVDPTVNLLTVGLRKTGIATWADPPSPPADNSTAAGSAAAAPSPSGAAPGTPPPPPFGGLSPKGSGAKKGLALTGVDEKAGGFLSSIAGGVKLKKTGSTKVVALTTQEESLFVHLKERYDVIAPNIMSPFDIIGNKGMISGMMDLSPFPKDKPLSQGDIDVLVNELFPQTCGKSSGFLEGFAEGRNLTTYGSIKEARLRAFYTGPENFLIEDRIDHVEKSFDVLDIQLIQMLGDIGDLEKGFTDFKKEIEKRWIAEGNKNIKFSPDFIRLEDQIKNALGRANDYPEKLEELRKLPFDQRLTPSENLERTRFGVAVEKRKVNADKIAYEPYLQNGNCILQALWGRYDHDADYRTSIERRIASDKTELGIKRPLMYLYQARLPAFNENPTLVAALKPSIGGAAAYGQAFDMKALHPLETVALVSGLLYGKAGSLIHVKPSAPQDNNQILDTVTAGLRERYGDGKIFLNSTEDVYHFSQRGSPEIKRFLNEFEINPAGFAEVMTLEHVKRARECKIDIGRFVTGGELEAACAVAEAALPARKKWVKPADDGGGPA